MRFSSSLLFSTLLAVGGSAIASAHHMMTNMLINGVDQGMGKCVRIPPNTDPVTDVSSTDMTCNVGGLTPVARACEVDAGSQITFIWRTWPDGSQPGSLDVSHQGPCSVYMKAVSDSTKSSGNGGGWFKIWEDGYRDGAFCTDRLRANDGRMTVKLPNDLKGGDYLIRAEQLALHQAQTVGGAQWYIGCGQLVVSSTGGSGSPAGVSIPGHVKPNDPGVLYNYWTPSTPYTKYIIPGPRRYQPGSTGRSRPTEHRKERGNWKCAFENANWCGRALPTFKNAEGCWDCAGNCWSQLEQCYNAAPATGSAGCRKLEARCEKSGAYCSNCEAEGNCNGSF